MQRLCMDDASLLQHVAKERSLMAAPRTLMCGRTLFSPCFLLMFNSVSSLE